MMTEEKDWNHINRILEHEDLNSWLISMSPIEPIEFLRGTLSSHPEGEFSTTELRLLLNDYLKTTYGQLSEKSISRSLEAYFNYWQYLNR